jgi:hypothetical protein
LGSTSRWVPNEYTLKWLEWYILWRRNEIPSRISVNGFCRCFNVQVQNNTEFPLVTDCHCETQAFPICRYHHTEHPLFHADLSMSPATRQLFRDGQAGIPFRGEFAQCQCFNGWTGESCEIATCGLPVANTTDSISKFFLKCSIHGSCDHGQPRMCKCNHGYGPPAGLDPSFPFAQFNDTPCACPATTERSGSNVAFQINGVVYQTTLTSLIPCAGVDHGTCTVDAATNQGRCACIRRSDGIAAYDGASCTCPVPVIPKGGTIFTSIVARYCNNRGTCCPHGERQYDEKIDGVRSSFAISTDVLRIMRVHRIGARRTRMVVHVITDGVVLDVRVLLHMI